MRRAWFVPLPALLVIALGLAPQEKAAPKGDRHDEHINKKFEDPDLNVDDYVKRFEAESREVAAKRAEILKVCGLKPGMAVADIGAGTGLFAFPFAEAVGPKGKVYAVDISPAFLKHLGDQAKKRGLSDVLVPTKGEQASPNLKADSVDLVFICDTYHHFEKPRPMLAAIHKALRAGGRVVVIDFDKRSDSTDFIKKHARAEKEVYFKEFEDAGFAKLETPDAPKLLENFLVVFRRQPVQSAP